MALIWREQYNLGIEIIDEQHREFFMALSHLSDMLASKASQSDLDEILVKLDNYVEHHFATEEKYFAEFNYADAEAHREAHEQFRAKLALQKTKLDINDSEALFYFLSFLEDWLVDHLMSYDRKYVDCFHEHGLK